MEHDELKDQVSIVLPNYSGRNLLQKHLPDVLACLRTDDEVIIVDDSSPDDSVAWLHKTFHMRRESPFRFVGTWKQAKKLGRLLVIRNAANLRFAATCNRGVAEAKGSLIFLLNTDVSPQPDCCEMLVRHFIDHRVFAVGCLEYADRLKGEESGKNSLWFERGLFVHSRGTDMNSGNTAWVSGGSGMFRKSIWQELGGFDVHFAPAYWEDIDLSYRAQKAGYRVLFDRNAVVIHQHETTNAQTFNQEELLKMSWRSADVFARKHASVLQLLQYYVWRPYWWWQRWKVLQ